jgi:hypothetical protein
MFGGLVEHFGCLAAGLEEQVQLQVQVQLQPQVQVQVQLRDPT